jgi:hypothetical protein
MKKQCNTQLVLILTIAILTIISGLVTAQTMWVYAQGNLSQVMNQTGNLTGNQTGNQSLSPGIPGQQGGTPPTS